MLEPIENSLSYEKIIQQLELEPHPHEGGYFKRTYEAQTFLQAEEGRRRLLTSIYYMLIGSAPVGVLHKNKSDILHFHHIGVPIRYIILSPEGLIEQKVLGSRIDKGETPQLLVKGGCWKASELILDDIKKEHLSSQFGLISEAVVPGFEYQDNEIANFDEIAHHFPKVANQLKKYIK